MLSASRVSYDSLSSLTFGHIYFSAGLCKNKLTQVLTLIASVNTWTCDINSCYVQMPFSKYWPLPQQVLVDEDEEALLPHLSPQLILLKNNTETQL